MWEKVLRLHGRILAGMRIEAGTRIGPYVVTASLGAGGMGEVYRARDPRIDRDVAIKVLPADYAVNAERLSRFTLEAKTTGSLNHPNLLVIFDFGIHDNAPYLVTELLEGETLRERMDRGTVSTRKAIEWTIQIAEGVAAAHEKGVIHRDIKPENIFLTPGGRVKLLDFGLAKLIADDPAVAGDADTFMRHTSPGATLGTPGYMAPEQVRGESIDERADIFGLGIVLAELAGGKHPFRRATSVETMGAILNADPVLPDAIPGGLSRIIEHMLAKDVGSRFQSMKDVAFALNLLSGNHSSTELAAPPRATASESPTREFLTLTLRRGSILNARFSSDGSVFYSAAWEGNPVEIFLSHAGQVEAMPIGAPGMQFLAVAPGGDLAVSLDRSFLGGWASIGTLARMRHSGGAPRKLHERVVDADFSPDGKQLAIIKLADDGAFVVECPIGRPLRRSNGWLSRVRFSRDGTRLAFMNHPWFGDDAGHPVVIDLEGHEVIAPDAIAPTTSGLAWSPDGKEIWFAGERAGFGRNILGYDMAGNQRLVLAAPGQLTLFDTRPDGAILLAHDTWRREAHAGRRGEPESRNLAWYDWPNVTALSADGGEILFEEQRALDPDGGGSAIFLRPVDGGPAVHVGYGQARAMSPDGKWIAATSRLAGHLELIPTGIGEPKLVKCAGFESSTWWAWFSDGKRLLFVGAEAGGSRFSREVSLETGETRSVGPGNLRWPCALSPDGESLASVSPEDQMMIYPMHGENGVPVLGARRGEWPICFSDDGKYLYVFPSGRARLSIDRLDLATGERVVWQEINPGDSAGIIDIHPIWLTPDGRHYAYSYRRCLSDLFLATTRSATT